MCISLANFATLAPYMESSILKLYAWEKTRFFSPRHFSLCRVKINGVDLKLSNLQLIKSVIEILTFSMYSNPEYVDKQRG